MTERTDPGEPPAAATEGDGASGRPNPGRRAWPQLRPDDIRSEFTHLVEQAAGRVQAATMARVNRPEKPESRWPVTIAAGLAVVLQVQLPHKLEFLPWYLLPALETALFIVLIIANPVRFERHSGGIRATSVAVILVISMANALSAVLLIHTIIAHGKEFDAAALLGSGAAIWATNVIAFSLWYWEFDRGGPVHRGRGVSHYPDLLFPQMTVPELTRPGWDAQFVDYLYLSFTNATAFSPTDVMPLARWAKLTMCVQSAVSLAVGALVIARAINILP